MTTVDRLVTAEGLTPTQARVLLYLAEVREGRPLTLSYAMSAVTLQDRGFVDYAYLGTGSRSRKRWFLRPEGQALVRRAMAGA